MPEKRDHDRRLLSFASQMRKAPTDAERKRWHMLRGNQLAGFHFRRQVPISGYIADFCCIEASVVVEVVEANGGQHYEHEGQAYDRRRTEEFRRNGFRVLRLSDVEFLKFPYGLGSGAAMAGDRLLARR